MASERGIKTTGKAFDSLAYAKRLETNGFTRQQAEVLAEEQNKLIDERLATKNDLEELKLSLTAQIEALKISTKADLEAGLARAKVEIIMWIMGIGFAQVLAQVALILGVLKFHG